MSRSGDGPLELAPRMAEPRVYLYRKAGRTVWDAEMWLPDGRRTTWRTGRVDRDHAEREARDRLASLIGAPTSSRLAPAAEEKPVLRMPSNIDNGATGAASPVHVDRRSDQRWLLGLDAWFFGDLKNLLAKISL